MTASKPLTSPAAPPVLEAQGLGKVYNPRRWLGRKAPAVRALNGVDLTLFAGRTLTLVGESGSGKSTLGRCLARLEEPSTGKVRFRGQDFLALRGAELRRTRRKIQMIFQDSISALNPRFSAFEIIAEPLAIARSYSRSAREKRVRELLDQTGLPQGWADRGAHQFSGGQKQRLALARALALEPAVLILDEALSGLDLSVQAQMINLLHELQASRQLAYLFILHDLSLVGALADQLAVMQAGTIVEQGPASEVLRRPSHPYTQSLLAALQATAYEHAPAEAVRQ